MVMDKYRFPEIDFDRSKVVPVSMIRQGIISTALKTFNVGVLPKGSGYGYGIC
jgi:hypothetical protein